MKNLPARNTYIDVTIFHYDDPTDPGFATIFISIEDAKLNMNHQVSYRAGQRELARLMLRLGQMPEVRKHDRFTCYGLHGFLD